MIDEQVLREKACTDQAHANVAANMAKAVETGNIALLPKSNAIIGRLFGLVQKELRVLLGPSKQRKTGYTAWLHRLPLDVLTVLTVRTVITVTIARQDNATVQHLATAVGRGVFREVKVREAEQVNPLYVRRTWNYLQRAGTTNGRHIERTMTAMVRNVLQDSYTTLTNTEHLHIGKLCVQACIDTGLLLSNRRYTAKGTLVTFRLTPELETALCDPTKVIINPTAQTMLVAPLPWTDTRNGGYITHGLRRFHPLIGGGGANRRSSTVKLRHTLLSNSSRVLGIINYLQSTPFRIHEPTFAVLDSLWKDGGGAFDVPRREGRPKPEFPFTGEEITSEHKESDQFKNWKRETAQWYTDDAKRRGTLIDTASTLRQAREVLGQDVFCPMMVDYRGRFYYRGTPNPQGADNSKGLLHFAEKKPLGDRGLYWLKVHIANCFGFDKVRFDQRAAWTEQNWNTLLAGSETPYNSDFYREGADSPFSAISAVKELSEALKLPDPRTYMTGIPIHMDATCSGLQHFSAMLRDPIGGKYTNLIDTGGDEKADIYRKVCELVLEQVERVLLDTKHPEWLLAKLWQEIGIKRKVAKKPTMTYVYGVTMRGCSDYCTDYAVEQGFQHDVISPIGMGNFMAKHMFDAIAKAVPAAAECMAWLRRIVDYAEQDRPIMWHSPTGFPVIQEYLKTKDKRVHIRSCGLHMVVIREHTNDNKDSRMRNGIAPNFVHSLDAAHLGMVAEVMRDNGRSTVGVHDSIGTHPRDVDFMHETIRDRFVTMYTKHNPLQELLDGLGITDLTLPQLGTLDINSVIDSEFFFC